MFCAEALGYLQDVGYAVILLNQLKDVAFKRMVGSANAVLKKRFKRNSSVFC